MYRRYRPLAIPQTQPRPRPFPTGRYARMNPPLRWCSLQVLAASLPDPLRAALISAWQHPGRFDGNQAIPTRNSQRPPENTLPCLPPSLLGTYTLIELEVGRRIVEVPKTEISQQERSRLLRAQAAYLRALYVALARQLGEAAALAEFERLLLKVK